MLCKMVTLQILVDHKVLQSRVMSGAEQSVVGRGIIACVSWRPTQQKQPGANTTLLAWCVSLIAGELLGSKDRVKFKARATYHQSLKVPSGASGKRFRPETTTYAES